MTNYSYYWPNHTLSEVIKKVSSCPVRDRLQAYQELIEQWSIGCHEIEEGMATWKEREGEVIMNFHLEMRQGEEQ
jgi:hypothetical protein